MMILIFNTHHRHRPLWRCVFLWEIGCKDRVTMNNRIEVKNETRNQISRVGEGPAAKLARLPPLLMLANLTLHSFLGQRQINFYCSPFQSSERAATDFRLVKKGLQTIIVFNKKSLLKINSVRHTMGTNTIECFGAMEFKSSSKSCSLMYSEVGGLNADETSNSKKAHENGCHKVPKSQTFQSSGAP